MQIARIVMLSDRENILSALREKAALKVREIIETRQRRE
jgi:hypothetical protein